MDDFTRGYIECLLWSSTAYGSPEETEQDPDREGRFDASFQRCGYDTLTPGALAACMRDCEAFQRDNAALLEHWYNECGESPERAGHDFWLTRNGHGAGYWDRWAGGTIGYATGKALTDKAHEYGSVDPWYQDGEVAV